MSNEIKLFNLHHFNGDIKNIKEPVIYIGRGGAWGNPHKIGAHKTRDDVISKHREELANDLYRIAAVRKELKGKSLACYCAPAPCHGDILMQVANAPSYAGIGSRKTPADVMNVMTLSAKRLSKRGYVLRSGGADGADSAFAQGAEFKEIFLPWKGFNGLNSPYAVASEHAMIEAEKFHPAWNRLSNGAKALHARNMHQILGPNLDDPVDFVLCWTPEGLGQGGTGQAIRIAKKYDIPVFDMGHDIMTTLKRLGDFLDNREAKEEPAQDIQASLFEP